MAKLVPAKIPHLNEPGMHSDGDQLYLQIKASRATGPQKRPPSKAWIFRFKFAGRARLMGLGAYPAVSLSDARALAAECRDMLARGIDPLDARDSAKAAALVVAPPAAAVPAPKIKTFADVAGEYIAIKLDEWRNTKHGQQWANTLATYAFPFIGEMPPADITVDHLLAILNQPVTDKAGKVTPGTKLWTSKTETASRVRNRIELIWSYAKVHKLCSGENPALWRGNLDALLAKPGKVAKVVHHPALPFAQASEFMAILARSRGVSARALEFLIFTAARSGEVLKAQWQEIDLEARLWTVPPERMKAGKEHRVPLSDAAVAVLRRMEGQHPDWIFPGVQSRTAMSDMSLTMLLRDIWPGITAHGFRSTFRDWAAEVTDYPGDLVEMALAHTIGNKAEAAYRRGDMVEKRRQLMADWAAHCAPPPAQ